MFYCDVCGEKIDIFSPGTMVYKMRIDSDEGMFPDEYDLCRKCREKILDHMRHLEAEVEIPKKEETDDI